MPFFRAQREEITRKKEKLEAMMKKGKNKDGVRPESPGARRRKFKRTVAPPNRRYLNNKYNPEVPRLSSLQYRN